MKTHEANPQEPPATDVAQEFITSSNQKIGRHKSAQPKWTLAGIDKEGGHHELQTADTTHHVIQNGALIAKESHTDVTQRRTIGDWRAYIAQKRWWAVLFLTVIAADGNFTNTRSER